MGIVRERQADTRELVGVELTEVRYVTLDYLREQFAPDVTGTREITDEREWLDPTWHHEHGDSADFGIEPSDQNGRTFSITWDPPGEREGLGMQATPLIGSAFTPGGDFAVWELTNRSRWTPHIGQPVTDVALHYRPWSGDAGYWCSQITLTVGGAPIIVLLAEINPTGGDIVPSVRRSR